MIIEENRAENAAGIFANSNSTVRFCRNATVVFINNIARDKGGAIYMSYHATVLFDQGSRGLFQNNVASNGGAVYSVKNCNFISEKNSVISFVANSASLFGGAMSLYGTKVTFKSSTIMIKDNIAYESSGGLHIHGIVT